MKKTIHYLLSGLIFAMTCSPHTSHAQSWGGYKKENTFWQNWSFNANLGVTSFFGDLSKYDTDPFKKITHESGPAYGGILTRHLSPKFSLAGQLLAGNLKGSNYLGSSFESSFIEYNFQGRFDILNIIWPSTISRFGVIAYGGIGQFLFNTTKSVLIDDGMEKSVNNTGVPEFVYIFGAGLYYKITPEYSITLDLAIRQTQNDKLDNYIKNSANDYYSHLSIGFSYNLENYKPRKHHTTEGESTSGRFLNYLKVNR
jgi:hypothetical protein